MDSKVCFKCKRDLPRSEFYKHPQMGDGLLGKCKECAKTDVRENYSKRRIQYHQYEKQRSQDPRRRELTRIYCANGKKRNAEKWKARYATLNAIRDGKLKRLPCEVCGNEKTEAHHEDYSKPMDVKFLCFKHHRQVHGQMPTHA